MEDDQISRLDEAHRLAKKHERHFFQTRDGAPKDEVSHATWLQIMERSYRRTTWAMRVLIVGTPALATFIGLLWGGAKWLGVIQ